MRSNIILIFIFLRVTLYSQIDTSNWELGITNMRQFQKKNPALLKHANKCIYIHHKRDELYGVSIYFYDEKYNIDFIFVEPIQHRGNLLQYSSPITFDQMPRKLKRRRLKQPHILD